MTKTIETKTYRVRVAHESVSITRLYDSRVITESGPRNVLHRRWWALLDQFDRDCDTLPMALDFKKYVNRMCSEIFEEWETA